MFDQLAFAALGGQELCTWLTKLAILLALAGAPYCWATTTHSTVKPNGCGALLDSHSKTITFGRVTIMVRDFASAAYKKGITADEVQLAAEAIAVVWTKFSSEPRTFELNLLSTIPGDYLGSCDKAGNVFLAVDSIAEFMPSIPRKVWFIFLTAHEATHAVQIARGDAPPVSSEDPSYPHNRFEYEAHEAGVDVLKAFSPNSSGAIELDGREYKVPVQSTYKRLATGLH